MSSPPAFFISRIFQLRIFSLQVKSRNDKHRYKKTNCHKEFARLYVVKCTFQSSRGDRYPRTECSKADTDQGRNFVSCLPPHRVQFRNRYLENLPFPRTNCTNKKSQSSKRVGETYHRVCKFPNSTRQLCRSAHLSNDCGILSRKYG